MRKIIFSVIMLYLFLCAFSQNLTISGLVKVYPGVYNYAISLNGSIEKDLEVTVVCSENGDLGGRQNPHKTTIIFKPKQSLLQQVFVEWGHVESKTEFIRAYATKDSSKFNTEIKNIEVSTDFYVPAPPENMDMIVTPTPLCLQQTLVVFKTTQKNPVIKSIKWLTDDIRIVSQTDDKKRNCIIFNAPGRHILRVKVEAGEIWRGDTVVHETREFSKIVNVIPRGIVGPYTLCGMQTFSVDDLAYDIIWSVSDNLEIVSGQGTAKVAVKSKSSSTRDIGEIKALVLGVEFVHKVWLGTPSPYFITTEIGKNSTLYPFQPELNNGEALWTGGGDPILEYDWQVPYWTITPYYANKSFVRFNVISQTTVGQSPINIKIRAKNRCGWGAWSGYIRVEVYPYPLHKSYIIYNYSGLVIVKESSELVVFKENINALLDYELYNQGNGILSAKGQIDRKGGTLDFSKLPKGIYILSLILDSNHRDTHRIIL